MELTRERIDECVATLLENPEIYDALKIIKGEDVNENEKKEFLSKIVESLILQKLAEANTKKQKSERGQNFAAKREDKDKYGNYEYDASVEKGISFSEGIKEFFSRMDYSFIEKEILLKSMSKWCKNYRFHESNIVNDYSILFFAFEMFGLYCLFIDDHNSQENCDQINSKEEIAELFSKITYEQLKKKYKYKIKYPNKNVTHQRRPVHISENALVSFCKKFPFDEYKYVYTLVFISFIQALDESTKLEDWEKYPFYNRFYYHIFLLNAVIKHLLQRKKRRKKTSIPFSNHLKLTKFISNKLQYLKKKKDKVQIKEIEKIRELFNKFPKSQEELDKIPKKTFHKSCNEIFAFLNNLNNYSSDASSEIVSKYMSLPFKTEDGNISYFELMHYELWKDYPDSFRFIKNELDKDNIYIQLIIPPPKRPLSNKEVKEELKSGTFARTAHIYSHQYNATCDKMISSIQKCVSDFFYIADIEKTKSQYTQVVEKIKLNNDEAPILSFDTTNFAFNDSLKLLSLFIN